MADVFFHPDAAKDRTAEKFELADGVVVIKSKSGDLTLSHALFLLKMVEAEIVALARK